MPSISAMKDPPPRGSKWSFVADFTGWQRMRAVGPRLFLRLRKTGQFPAIDALRDKVNATLIRERIKLVSSIMDHESYRA